MPQSAQDDLIRALKSYRLDGLGIADKRAPHTDRHDAWMGLLGRWHVGFQFVDS